MNLELEKKFSQANLPVQIFDNPKDAGFNRGFGSNNTDIFQMSIREIDGIEYFILCTGKSNEVNIIDVNKEERQVILELLEPEREFTRYEWIKGKRHEIIDTTPPELRKYLIGHDEISLFMCELPSTESNTVKEAHEELKPRRVKKLKRANIKRQGEWFFVPISKSEKAILHRGMIIYNKQIEGSAGKPHMASEIVYIRNRSEARLSTIERLSHQFVRGSITHPDHFPLELRKWHRVYRNLEVQRRGSNGISIIHGWID
ncbi:MAG: hypothetical protein ACFFG0_22580 [Candidatus Thorarchaeota archaeon]